MLPASHRPFNEGPTRTLPFWYVGSVSLTNNQKVLVLIGLMGAGKTSVGRKLAEHLNMRFVDADEEIVRAAGCSIPDIFENYGEPAFRDVEERVIKRLLPKKVCPCHRWGCLYESRNPRRYLPVWLLYLVEASLDILVKRTEKRRGVRC